MPANKFSILCTSEMDIPPKHILPENISIDIIPLIKKKIIHSAYIKETAHDLLNKKITAIFTSKTAVMAIAAIHKIIPLWKIYCIENSTKHAVKQYFPMSAIAGTAGNARDLAKKIIDNGESEVVFFCGNKRLDDLPVLLKGAGIVLKEYIVYETLITAKKITKEYEAIIFLSPSAVQSFYTKNSTGNNTTFFALGKKTAEAIHRFTNNQIIVAHFPGKENILTEAIDFLNTPTIAQ